MADVVDIPEFRAFYYTDDTPRQFYTLRRYEDESGSGKMHCYNIILTTMADQCLTTPLVYPHQLAVYSDKIANYDFPPDANFTAVQNITLK